MFNNTSKILPYIADTGIHGVILPNSSRLLFASDIDAKIQKTESHIGHLFNAQSHNNTDGGKGVRKRKWSLQDHTDSFSQRLALLTSAKKVAVILNSKDTFLPILPSTKTKLLQLNQEIESKTHSQNIKQLLDTLFENETVFAIISKKAVSVDNVIKTVSVLQKIEETIKDLTEYKTILAAASSLRFNLTNILVNQ